jgi:hypothetical protein
VVLAMLVGCALRREELTVLDVDTIQLRKVAGSWPIWKEKAAGSHRRHSGMGEARSNPDESPELLNEIQRLIEEARRQTATAVNFGLTALY